MKWFAQVLGSIVYTFVFSIILYFITIVPLASVIAWFLSLSTFWKIVVLIIVPGVGFGLLFGLIQSFATLPYLWLVKDNITALIISIGILVVNIVRYIIMIWSDTGGNIGVWSIILCIIASLVLLIAGIQAVFGIIMAYKQE